MAKRTREDDISNSKGATVEELCQGVKRLHAVTANENSLPLHPQQSLDEHTLAAVKGDSHPTVRRARLPEPQLSGLPYTSTPPRQNNAQGVFALSEPMKAKDDASLYEQFNRLLKDLHFERLRRTKDGTLEQTHGS